MYNGTCICYGIKICASALICVLVVCDLLYVIWYECTMCCDIFIFACWWNSVSDMLFGVMECVYICISSTCVCSMWFVIYIHINICMFVLCSM